MSELRWPFLPSRNISIQRADGVYLYDDKGKEIIDAAGGAIVVNVGHGRQRVADAVAKATKDYSYVVPPWLTPSRQAMLDALAEHWLPEHLTRVHCTSGGTEANEAAMKMAQDYRAHRELPRHYAGDRLDQRASCTSKGSGGRSAALS
jgi:taurine--2-oxoglutarate transaminase